MLKLLKIYASIMNVKATSEQVSLVPIFLLHKKISRPLHCSSFTVKSHVCFGYAFASARITPPLHYQLFTGLRLTALLFRSIPIFYFIKNPHNAPSFLLFRKKARSVRLFACKRAHLRLTVGLTQKIKQNLELF